MSKRQESASDRVWKDKADLCASPGDVALTIVLVLALVGVLCILNI
jgi:hypothetical protein